ncbi:hypothetical protein Ancab_030136, partial [Ancistrocladus abbreviatus]
PVPNEPKETTLSSEHNNYGGLPSMRSVKSKSKYDSKDSSTTSKTVNISANFNEDHDNNINEGSSLYPGCHDKIHISSTKENRGLPVHGPPTSKAYQKNIVIHKGTNMHKPTNEENKQSPRNEIHTHNPSFAGSYQFGPTIEKKEDGVVRKKIKLSSKKKIKVKKKPAKQRGPTAKNTTENLEMEEVPLPGVSIEDNGIDNINLIFWEKLDQMKAEEMWKFSKLLGTSFNNNKEELLAHIEHMETRDRRNWEAANKEQ